MQTLTPNKKRLNITPDQVKEFSALITQGVEAWIKAGELLVKMVDGNPSAYAAILRECPHLSVDTLLAFEKIGRREILPYLLLETCPGAKALAKLPFALQDKYYKEEVEVLVGLKGGRTIVSKKPLRHMTRQEADRVFAPGGVRSIEEQRRLLPDAENCERPTRQSVGINARSSVDRPKDVALGYFVVESDKAGNLSLVKVEKPTGGVWNYVTISFPTASGLRSAPFCIDKSC